MNKKGYFFTLDAMLSLGILVLGSLILFASYTKEPSKAQTANIANDVSEFFEAKIKDINNPYCGIGSELWRQGYITNEDNSLMQQIGEFYYNYNQGGDAQLLTIAEKCVINVTADLIPPQYKLEFWIDNILLHPSFPTQQHIYSKGNTTILLPSKNIAYGILDNDLFGPYEAEVLVWQ